MSTDIQQRFAFPALLIGNLFLAAGPWMVRLADVGPTASAFWRFALALPLLIVLAHWSRSPAKAGVQGWDRWLIGAVMLGGLFFAIDLVLWHESILRTRLANATLFGNMSSFLFVLYGFIVLRALPRPLQAAALALAGAGAALLLGGSYELSPAHFTGDLLALGAAFFYALYLIAADRARRVMASWPVLAIATAAGTLPLFLFALAMGEQVMPGDWTPLILLSLGSQVIGQGLLVYAMGHLSPAVVGIGLLTQPVASAAIGWFAYRESLSAADAIGALLICAALVLVRLPARGVATLGPPAQ
ncbi:DMT family transporter [Sphingosinicella sp.]|uniref:DMT family transporter n=1 Tax=Sphingosinicella sp. TaxID=1917971 RepID=UPI004037ACEA